MKFEVRDRGTEAITQPIPGPKPQHGFTFQPRHRVSSQQQQDPFFLLRGAHFGPSRSVTTTLSRSGIDQQNPGGRSWCGRGARGADGDGVEALREALRHKSRGGRRGSRPGCSGRERVLVQAQPRHCGWAPAVPLRRSRGSVSADAYAPQDPGGGRAAPSLAVPEGRLRERPGARARRWPRRSLPPSQGRRPREGEAKLGNFVDARVARERASER